MLIVGFLFGLSFDTATEIALLSMAAAVTLKNISIGAVLLLPVLFACGMILTDSTNCIVMSAVYNLATHPIQLLRKYNTLIYGFTAFTAFTAFSVGMIELLNYLQANYQYKYPLISLLARLADKAEILGGVIVALFILLWARLLLIILATSS
jgi:high-affinity nickel-transport protein